MLHSHAIPIWKKAPFTRLLLPLIAGIILQWYIQLPVSLLITSFVSFSIAYILFLLLPVAYRYAFSRLQGTIIQLLFICLGALITWQKDIRHVSDWFGHYYSDSSFLVVRIDEPPVEKNKSYKADGYVESVIQHGKTLSCSGKILLYFSKDSPAATLKFGDRVIVHKALQRIRNSGNPGAFNYQRFAAFRGIFHQVFLKTKDWALIPDERVRTAHAFRRFIYSARAFVLDALRQNIETGKDELAIAEALLIGYTNDLDKDLVQAYSNTGVVHIIAISGMHLALIYVLLAWLFAKVPFISRSKLLQLVLLLSCLWLFSLLTGASPSVLRAAVMFSCIAIGRNLKKQSSIYNALAASAFILLCYDPYYLWSPGFQLSYLAVLGIVIFQKPLYDMLYTPNKWLLKCWQLVSVSTAAQVLTFPVCLFYFHQFPNLFLVTNLVAVPLSAIILYAVMALVAFSWIPYAGLYVGKLAGGLTWIMNEIIRWVNDLPFAVWDMIPASVLSTWLLYAAITGFAAWTLLASKRSLLAALAAFLAFILLISYNKWATGQQQRIIVYNVPGFQAIDLARGNSYAFIGDSILLQDGALQNFHLKPGRIEYQLRERSAILPAVFKRDMFYQFNNTKFLILNKPVHFETPREKTELDMIIISKGPKLSIAELVKVFECRTYVFDASNPRWMIKKWEAECRRLKLNYHPVPDSGAFIYNVGM